MLSILAMPLDNCLKKLGFKLQLSIFNVLTLYLQTYFFLVTHSDKWRNVKLEIYVYMTEYKYGCKY